MGFPPKSSLVGHWKMNDAADNQNISDSSGNNRHGSWVKGNTSADTANGKVNKALIFNGYSDSVVFTDDINDPLCDSLTDPAYNNSTFTFCVWLQNLASRLNWNRILSKKENFNDVTGYEVCLGTASSQILYISGVGDAFATIETTDWMDYAWHHLVVVFNNDKVDVYCDGVWKGQSGIVPVVANDYILRFGKIKNENNTLWNGLMDDVRYYNIALNQSQVDSIYNDGNGTEISYISSKPFVSFKPGQPAE